MFVSQLKLHNFKNHHLTEFQFGSQINCITGMNGTGKTNVLDALYYLSFTKSFFNQIDSQNVQYDAHYFSIDAQLTEGEMSQQCFLSFQLNGKKLLRFNQNEPDKFSDHIGNIPLVMMVPSDINLIAGFSEIRRKLIDTFLSMVDKTYLHHLIQYHKALDQRAKVIKNYLESGQLDDVVFDVFTEKLVSHGTAVFELRKEFLQHFVPDFTKHYAQISDAKETADIVYESDLSREDFHLLLSQTKHSDLSSGRTGKGIHKDDFEFLLDDRPIKKYGSQGQQKSFIIALKLAQFDYLKKHLKRLPLLLIDDIFEKLDATRLQQLTGRISNGEFGQVFITDTHKDRLEACFQGIPSVDVRYFELS